jgi:hypothetical protein
MSDRSTGTGGEEKKVNVGKMENAKVLYKTMAFRVEEDLHTLLKLNSIKNNKQMGIIINDLIRDYLKSQGDL